MKYSIPSIASLVISLAGLALILLGYPATGQSAVVLAYLASFAGYKKSAGYFSSGAVVFSGIILAWAQYTPGVFPLLSIAIIIASVQNIFIELVFPALMYSDLVFKITAGILSFACYVLANLVFPSGWQGWTFPGIMLLLTNLLTALIIWDIVGMKKTAEKGFIGSGKKCPEFTLPDENGTMVSSFDFLGKHLLIIFVRGDWCPGCHITLRSYQRNKEKFLERDVHVLSIGPDPLGVNKEMVQKLGLTYRVLSDEKQRVAQQFCVELQQPIGSTPADYEFIPLPASFLVDKTGTVCFTSRADRPGDLFNPDKIFEVLEGLN